MGYCVICGGRVGAWGVCYVVVSIVGGGGGGNFSFFIKIVSDKLVLLVF